MWSELDFRFVGARFGGQWLLLTRMDPFNGGAHRLVPLVGPGPAGVMYRTWPTPMDPIRLFLFPIKRTNYT